MQHTKNHFLASLSLVSIGILITLFLTFSHSSLSADFQINEVSFQNNDREDWIEIYNPSFNTRSLKGFYLSDDKENITKYEITDEIIIYPNGFVVIYGKNYDGDEQVIQTNFAIKNGETIYLADRNQMIIDSFTVVGEEGSSIYQTLGKFPDGSEEIFIFSTPTSGEKNIKDQL